MTKSSRSGINPVSVELGAHVHQVMWSRRVSQKQLAEALGIAQPGVSSRLRGKVDFSIPELVAVAKALGVSSAELLARATGEVVPAASGAAAALASHAVNGPTQYLEGTIEAHNEKTGPGGRSAGPGPVFFAPPVGLEPTTLRLTATAGQRPVDNVVELAAWRERAAS